MVPKLGKLWVIGLFTQTLALLSNYQLQMKYKELKECNANILFYNTSVKTVGPTKP